MSESEYDLDDELLHLAGASSENKRSKTSSSSRSKKRKVDSDNERDIESEEMSDVGPQDENADPYPYEGTYIDAEDKQKLLAMPEIKREEILAERSEQKSALQEKRLLAQMVRQQKSAGMGAGLDEDSVARAAKRQHTARGATKEKSRKLDELKARRKAKDESRKRAKMSPKSHRDRSASPQDMDISDEDSEDGMISRDQQQEERDRRLLGLSASASREEPEDTTPATVESFNRCRLTRDLVAKWCLSPWFREYVKGAWVRYLIGNEENQPIYRPYKVNDRAINHAVELKHGKSIKVFNMDRISNSPFTDREFDRLSRTCKQEGVSLPTRKELQKKHEQMRELEKQPMTEKDISAMLERKKAMSSTPSIQTLRMDRSKLNQQRSLALKRQDAKEVEILDAELARVQAQMDRLGADEVVGDTMDEKLRRVNERNRKANTESVRRAEVVEAERKRREREVMAKAAAQGGVAAGVAVAMKYDPSARLKTVPRMFNAATPTTRPATPANDSTAGTPAAEAKPANGAKPGDCRQIAFEQQMLDTIEIDLGDF
ncbi:hypothetical protein FA13DRAFT_1756583 [Coprinellus micaceus]|uniref:Plus3 domain-containing protein n=1 Tax=Coprinellus micaceus TaxID=71717 RepID=A0A4Y7SV91_COPMI|nr:hypothetical protein FA13DRAFT_1756583 [Coprinellus micaceus]